MLEGHLCICGSGERESTVNFPEGKFLKCNNFYEVRLIVSNFF